MKVLALDVSSKTGWALLENESPLAWGTLFPDKTVEDFGPYPFNYVEWAEYVVERLMTEVFLKYWVPGVIVVVEETNVGKNCYSQKRLEMLHFCLIKALRKTGAEVKYVRTGEWRHFVDAKMSKEEKALNAKIARIKKKTGKKLAKIDGKVVGRKGRKHVSIRRAEEIFGIEMQRSEEDAGEALLLGLGFIRGAPACNGRTDGGKSNRQVNAVLLEQT